MKAKDIPFLMKEHWYVGSEKLNPEDTIEPAIKHGSLSIGFIGLAEALIYLVGDHHGNSRKAQLVGLSTVKAMRDYCDEMAEKYNLNFALFSSPAEGLAGKLPPLDRAVYGTIEGVTDKDYYTNSFHVPVYCDIGFQNKIEIEGPYHKYCNGGCISYIEMTAPPRHNNKAIETIIKCMAENDFTYGGINYPLCYCLDCNYAGVYQDKCPNCFSKNIQRLYRITGYISEACNINDGKMAEIKDRHKHC